MNPVRNSSEISINNKKAKPLENNISNGVKILVIAPHADDEVLGVGATIAKHIQQGDEVYRCIMTAPYRPEWSKNFIGNRKKEIEKSGKILGVEKTYLLNYPTVKLDTVPQKKLNDALIKIMREVKPDIVYTPHFGDLNKDHRLTYEATLVATRPIPNAGYSVKKLLCYETVSETEWGRSLGEFSPNYYETLGPAELKLKLSAMRAYKSEIRKYPHPRSLETLSLLAKYRGSEVGQRLAEAFMIIREIN